MKDEFAWLTEEELERCKIELPRKQITEREFFENQLEGIIDTLNWLENKGEIYGSLRHKTLLSLRKRTEIKLKNLK